MSRMFKSITRTWPIFTGCDFGCSYCNARKTALTRLKHHPRYKDGFKPHFNPEVLNWHFKPREFIFIAYMGDIYFATLLEASLILSQVDLYPKTDFLLCTKDPGCFSKWKLEIPPNVYLGTTIETNRDYGVSKAPRPYLRFRDLACIRHRRKFLSIEPIMDFDLKTLLGWVRSIKPEIIEVGADNYHNHLPEPSSEKLERLLNNLREICPTVIEKDGLNRLKESK